MGWNNDSAKLLSQWHRSILPTQISTTSVNLTSAQLQLTLNFNFLW